MRVEFRDDFFFWGRTCPPPTFSSSNGTIENCWLWYLLPSHATHKTVSQNSDDSLLNDGWHEEMESVHVCWSTQIFHYNSRRSRNFSSHHVNGDHKKRLRCRMNEGLHHCHRCQQFWRQTELMRRNSFDQLPIFLHIEECPNPPSQLYDFNPFILYIPSVA